MMTPTATTKTKARVVKRKRSEEDVSYMRTMRDLYSCAVHTVLAILSCLCKIISSQSVQNVADCSVNCRMVYKCTQVNKVVVGLFLFVILNRIYF